MTPIVMLTQMLHPHDTLQHHHTLTQMRITKETEAIVARIARTYPSVASNERCSTYLEKLLVEDRNLSEVCDALLQLLHKR